MTVAIAGFTIISGARRMTETDDPRSSVPTSAPDSMSVHAPLLAEAPGSPSSRPPRPNPRPAPSGLPAWAPATFTPLDEELEHQLPDWIPRPVQARSAEGADLARRSDGHFSGVVQFGFEGNADDPLEDIIRSLEDNGLSRKGDGMNFHSEEPPRDCSVAVRHSDDGSLIVTLTYEGHSHGDGCACPTCGLDADESGL